MTTSAIFLLFLWLPAGVGAIVYVLRSKPSRQRSSACRFCGYPNYDERSYLCPECGRPTPHPWYPKPFLTNEARAMFWAGTVCAAVGTAVHTYALINAARLKERYPDGVWGVLVPAILCGIALLTAVTGTQASRHEGSSLWRWPATLATAAWVAMVFMLLRYC